MSSCINIGPSKEAVDSVRDSICTILDAVGRNSLGDESSVAAFDAFAKATQVNNVSITHCNFEMVAEKQPDKPAAKRKPARRAKPRS